MKVESITSEYIHGAVSLEPVGEGLKPWRIPYEQKVLYYPEDGLQNRAETAAGVRVRFSTNSSSVTLAVQPQADERIFDLVARNELLQTVALEAGDADVRFEHLPGHDAVYDIWLPQSSVVVVNSLAVDDTADLHPAPDTRTKWITYGSSISHCGAAHSPARTWPATAARLADVNLTCLGYGGNCMLDPLVAMLIRDLPADIITMKLGINVHGQGSLNGRTYQPAVIGLVRIVREKHPTLPIGIITSISCPMRETTPNAVGRTLEDYRRDNGEAVRRLREAGDPNLHLFDGRELLGPEEDAHLPDGLHPDGDGYEIIGRRAAELVLAQLKQRVKEKA